MASFSRRSCLCLLVLYFAASYGFSQAIDECQVKLPNYNLTVLLSPAAWVVHNQPCSNETSTKDCSYYFAVCHEISLSAVHQSCHGAGVCQVNDVTQEVKPLGVFSTAVYRDIKDALKAQPQGEFEIQFIQPQGSGKDAISTVLAFQCNQTVSTWTTTGEIDKEALVPSDGLIGVVHGGYDSMYSLQFRYPGACYTGTPSNRAGSSSLGGGTIFVIVVLCLVATYLIVGCTIGRVQGKTGFDAMPNADLWRSCGSHIKMGCGAVCKPCSGGDRSKGKGYEEL